MLLVSSFWSSGARCHLHLQDKRSPKRGLGFLDPEGNKKTSSSETWCPSLKMFKHYHHHCETVKFPMAVLFCMGSHSAG